MPATAEPLVLSDVQRDHLRWPMRIEQEDAAVRELLRHGLLERVCGDYFTTQAGKEANRHG